MTKIANWDASTPKDVSDNFNKMQIYPKMESWYKSIAVHIFIMFKMSLPALGLKLFVLKPCHWKKGNSQNFT